MSDYGKLQEIERLYNMAVDYGMIPPNWDGTPPAGYAGPDHPEHNPPGKPDSPPGKPPEARHGEHRAEGKRS